MTRTVTYSHYSNYKELQEYGYGGMKLSHLSLRDQMGIITEVWSHAPICSVKCVPYTQLSRLSNN